MFLKIFSLALQNFHLLDNQLRLLHDVVAFLWLDSGEKSHFLHYGSSRINDVMHSCFRGHIFPDFISHIGPMKYPLADRVNS